jgi:spermidine synthase
VAKIGKVYVLESIGAAAGGILGSFLLIRYFNSLQITVYLGLLNLSVALLLGLILDKPSPCAQGLGKSKLRVALILSTLILGFSNIFLVFSGKLEQLHKRLLNFQWKGYNLVASKDSIYGNVSVMGKDRQRSFFVNGLLQSSIPDELSAEESVHFALLEHPSPKRVLLIGGGVGLLSEILKHPVEKIDYVELDPLIIKMSKDYLDSTPTQVLEDLRVKIENVDGRLFVKQNKEKFDCIIISLADPSTAQLNRFYTLEFFRELKRILTEEGIVSFGVTSSENYISDELKDYLSCLYKTLSQVFPEVKVIPGEVAYFLASNKKGALTYDYKLLMERMKARNIEAKFVREYYLASKLSPPRMKYLEDRIMQFKGARLNRDFQPVCYYYDIILWSGRFESKLKDIMKVISERMLWIVAATVYSLLLLAAILKWRSKKRTSVLTAVATTGFSEIVFQIAVILSFQIIYGHIYYKLGIIIAAFMVGLTLGGWWVTKFIGKLNPVRYTNLRNSKAKLSNGVKGDYSTFIKTQVAISIYPLLLPLIFWSFSSAQGKMVGWLGRNIAFPLLPIISGFIGGFQYPLANKICLEDTDRIGQVAGLTYGLDLAGAAVGALLVSTFFLPIIGVYKTCFMVALLNISVLILLAETESRPNLRS